MLSAVVLLGGHRESVGREVDSAQQALAIFRSLRDQNHTPYSGSSVYGNVVEVIEESFSNGQRRRCKV